MMVGFFVVGDGGVSLFVGGGGVGVSIFSSGWCFVGGGDDDGDAFVAVVVVVSFEGLGTEATALKVRQGERRVLPETGLELATS